MSLEGYLKIQNKEFEEFVYNTSKQILLAAATEEDLIDFYKKRGETVKKYKENEAYLAETENGELHLFIKGPNKSYRSIFTDFLYDKYQVSKESVESKWNVDHVFNKARANTYFIRMILLDEKVNKQWGRAYESVITKIENSKTNSKKKLILLDYSVLLKVIGIESPKKSKIKNDSEIINISNTIKDTLDNIFPNHKIDEYSLKVFLRAELNLLKNKKWRDHKYKEFKQLEFVYTNPKDALEICNLREIFQYLSLKSHECTVYLFGDEYEIYHTELKNFGKVISTCKKEVYDHLVCSIKDVGEVNIRFTERNNKITEVKVTTFKEGSEDSDTFSYQLMLR